MRICCLVHTRNVGLGHYYRTMTFVDHCISQGHDVTILGDVNFTDQSYNFFGVRAKKKWDLYHALHQIKPDWLVYDTPTVDYVDFEFTAEFDVKTLFLNANQNHPEVDISIIQGYNGVDHEFSGSEYVILRPEIFEYTATKNVNSWFVFGGAEDNMGLLPYFYDKFNVDANLIVTPTNVSFGDVNLPRKKQNIILPQNPNDIFSFMLMSNKALISMGMIAWELVSLGIPTFVISPTENHYKFAKGMEENGLVVAYNSIGKLPPVAEIVEFSVSNFQVNGEIPEKFACKRILNIMEKY